MNMSKRIESIVAELERLKLEEEAPVDDLSRSLFNLGKSWHTWIHWRKRRFWLSLTGLTLWRGRTVLI